MIPGLTPENQQFLDDALASGLFPSQDALLNQAIGVLRRREDMAALENDLRAGLAQLDAGQGIEMSAADFDALADRAVSRSHNSH